MARAPASAWLRALALAGLVGSGALAAPRVGAEGPSPAAGLAHRVEAHLAVPAVRDALRESLGHYGLVLPVTQPALRAYLEPVRILGRPGHRVVATVHGLEPHGGGVLALLLRHWRPEGRPAELSDAYPFEAAPGGVPLAELYASLRRQVFLPVPGTRPDEIAGALPPTPQLARVRVDLRDAGLPGRAREADAYHALSLLAAHERDADATWTNALGQRLSVRRLLDHAGRHYLEGHDTAGEPEDHGELHLVEVLLGAGAASPTSPRAIQRRFLTTEMQRRVFEPADEALLLGHHAESLGALMADPRVHWSSPERAQVLRWLAWLDAGPFQRLEGLDPRALAHLLRGLRLVEAHAHRLREPPSAP